MNLDYQTKKENKGKVLRISGTVIDVQFNQENVPDIYNKLIILGNASTLTKHSFYKQLYDYIKKKGKIISVCTEEIS